ncbi:MAG TPA: peptidoglycan DD-metalloendopeptidase family protein [Bacillota bacterium]|nr:peptidoglycan DD-metalloendopeptidase family protein [Bacillota bacterium]
MNRQLRLIVFVLSLLLVLGLNVSAISWSGPALLSGIPGSGLVQTLSSYILPDGSELVQTIWRGDQGFQRTVPIVSGNFDWNHAGSWLNPISITSLPGSGSIQTLDEFILPDRSALLQGLWRGNQGFYRTVPIINNQISWLSAGSWSNPSSISTLPGSGDVQGQQNILIPGRNYLFQEFCRGGNFYWRTVPIVNRVIQWPSASIYYGPLEINGLPGSGQLLAMDAYLMPNGTELQMGFWRGDTAASQTGYYRNIRLNYPNDFSLVEDGTSNLGWPFDNSNYSSSGTSPYHKGCDYYADDWWAHDGSILDDNALAMAPGIVIFAGTTVGWSYGNHVIVQCLDNPRFAYMYAHLADMNVTVGDIVGFNTLIGHVGNSGGDFSPHLHDALYQKITTADNSYNNLRLGYCPSGSINAWPDGTRSSYAAPFVNLGDSTPTPTPPPSTPTPTPPSSSVIVDDGDPGFALYGQPEYWHRQTIGNGGDMYWTYVNGTTVSNYARWTPTLPSPGLYMVEVYIPNNYATTRLAKYTVIANGITNANYSVNQNNFYNSWVTLGVFYFSANYGSEYVELTDATGEALSTYYMIGFDAVRFTKQ